MFFLGAGFLLVETKAVVHMALLFGGTWTVNSVGLLRVLAMILLANTIALKLPDHTRARLPYALLLLALGLNAVVPLGAFLGLRRPCKPPCPRRWSSRPSSSPASSSPWPSAAARRPTSISASTSPGHGRRPARVRLDADRLPRLLVVAMVLYGWPRGRRAGDPRATRAKPADRGQPQLPRAPIMAMMAMSGDPTCGA